MKMANTHVVVFFIKICVFPAKLAINFPGLNQIETAHVIIKLFSPGSQFETQHELISFHVISPLVIIIIIN
jgi:hypothetical protein